MLARLKCNYYSQYVLKLFQLSSTVIQYTIMYDNEILVIIFELLNKIDHWWYRTGLVYSFFLPFPKRLLRQPSSELRSRAWALRHRIYDFTLYFNHSTRLLVICAFIVAYIEAHGIKHWFIFIFFTQAGVTWGGYLQALRELVDSWPPGAWHWGKLLMLVLGKRHVKYTVNSQSSAGGSSALRFIRGYQIYPK